MNSEEARKRHAVLANAIRDHDYAYYVQGSPTISDFEYDRLYRELGDLEKEHPNLVTPDSPTQRVGGQPLSEFRPVEHRMPMLSLDNTYSKEEVQSFLDRVARLLPGQALEWVVEPKV